MIFLICSHDYIHKSNKNSGVYFLKINSALNLSDILYYTYYIFIVFILFIRVSFYRLGYTYVSLKNNYMEILNRENNSEK